MKYTIFDMKGFDDYKSWLREDRLKYEKINNLIISIQRYGSLGGIGKTDVLKGNYKGCYSRRIDDKNRLIYNVSSDVKSKKTLILSCREHYQDVVFSQKKALLQNPHI